MGYSFNARTALVTGAGQTSGEGIAKGLAAEGVAVVVNDLFADRAQRVAQEINDSGGRAYPVVFDVTDFDAVKAGFAEAEQALAPIDILVNNAGMLLEPSRHLPFHESDPELDWKPWIDLNVYGSMYCMRTALPGMVERGWGRVIQISSGLASRGLPNNESMLGASKGAIEALIRNVALEVIGSGVTVNAVALGLMSNAVVKVSPEVVQRTLAKVPIGRFGEPEDAAASVIWLASEEASFITGQVVHYNGGSVQGR